MEKPSDVPDNPDSRPYKWFVSGTPIETSPGNFEGSMSTLKRKSWAAEDSPFHYCRSDILKAWGTAFKNFLDSKDKGQTDETINRKKGALADAESHFPSMLPLFLIRRTDLSKLWGHDLVTLPDLTIRRMPYSTSQELLLKIAELRSIITEQIHIARAKVYKTWVRNGRNGPEPNLSNDVVLRLTYRLRVLASLPGMIDLIRERGLSLTQKEAVENRWFLSDSRSPWRSKVAEICTSSGKLDAIKHLLTKHLKNGEKVVIVSEFAVAAVVISLVGIFHRGQHCQSKRGS